MLASTDFAVNIVMLINITINKTFRIHVLVKNYSCYNVFDQKNVNTFNVLDLIQVRTDENKFTEIRNVDRFQCFNIQVSTDKNKFMEDKKCTWARIYFYN